MKETSERLKLSPTLTFDTPDGGQLVARSVRFEVTHQADALKRVVLEFIVAPDDWQRVDAGKWFHLTDEVRGPTFGGSLLADVDVEIEVRLAEEHLGSLEIVKDNVFKIGGHILAGVPEFRQTESWLGLYVKQPRGPVKTGFSTT